MASTIQIKRGTGSAVPTGLADGELAINLDNGQLYFGSGSTSVNSFRFKNLTADNYIVSSSVTNITTQTLSGSTQFGDSTDDTHQFTGNITSSGNISSSGIITAEDIVIADDLTVGDKLSISTIKTTLNNANSFVLTDNNDQPFIHFSSGIEDQDSVLLLGDKEATGNETQLKIDDGNELITSNVNFEITKTTDATDATGDTGALRVEGGASIAKKVFVGTDLNIGGSITSNITASGNISSSGTIIADAYNLGGEAALSDSGTTLYLGNSNAWLKYQIGRQAVDQISITGAITASGNISASGIVTSTGGFTGTVNTATQGTIDHDSLANFVANEHIDHSGVSITAGAGLTGGGTIASTRDIAVGAGTGITVNANDVAIGQDVATTANVLFNNITASGNISSSGTITANGGEFTDDITLGDTKKLKGVRLVISASSNNNIYGGSTFPQNVDFSSGVDVTGDSTLDGNLDLTDSNAILDIQGQGDATDATGDTGALRCEGGASIAKKLFVGTDLNIGGQITSNITASGNITTLTGTITA